MAMEISGNYSSVYESTYTAQKQQIMEMWSAVFGFCLGLHGFFKNVLTVPLGVSLSLYAR